MSKNKLHLRIKIYNMKFIIILSMFAAVACNDKSSEPPLKPSNFAAPIVDTVATKADSNAYIIKP